MPAQIFEIVSKPELGKGQRQTEMVNAAVAWWDGEALAGHTPAFPSADCIARWPILCAWRWLVDSLDREEELSGDLHSSAAGVRREHAIHCA